MLVEVLGTVRLVGKVNDEVGLRRLISVPVGSSDEIVDISNASTDGVGCDSDVEGSANVVGHHLLESGIEEEGIGVVGKKVDNTNGDDVGASSEDAVGTTDESVGGGGLTAGSSSGGGDVSGRKVLSDELDAIDIDDVTGTSLDSQLKAIIASGAHGDSASEEPDVLSAGGRRVGRIKGVEASDGSSSIPVGNECGGVGPHVGLRRNLEGDIIREIVDATSTLIDGSDSVVATLTIGHLDVEVGTSSPAITKSIGKVNVDDTSGEAVENVLGRRRDESRRVVGLTSRISDGVGLFSSP